MISPAISVSVSLPDDTNFNVARGHSIIEHGLPADPDTRFNVGSVAKQITAHLVIDAARQRKIDLTAPARTFLPRLVVDDVTVADLITHTSGIRDTEAMLSLCGYRDLDHYTATDLLTLAYRQQRRCALPGQFLYSNTNYLLLAAILESVHDPGFDELAGSSLFKPLGMAATAFRPDARAPIAHAASSYEATGSGFTSGQRPVAIAGPGSLWTTPSDLLIWLRHLTSVIAPHWPARLPRAAEIAYVPCGRGHTYGPGLFAINNQSQPAVFHNGHEHGYSASTYLRGDNLALACASNADWIPADKVMAELVRTRCTPEDVEMLVGEYITHQPREGSFEAPTASGEPLEDLGRYHARELPGSIRLGRHPHGLSVIRRGTVDNLQPDPTRPRRFTGRGIAITLASPGIHPPDEFVLDLDRAPGIHYLRAGG
ncbi:beta-lactamase family protein [Actinospica sp. MGRD01-02]|uniref:Beta-lactamase family protein n=1 Tax=Actinospica acidithermotolerans TaxID=2828514 RepID=A0A941E649_9ACTN|nr:serine hydrolase domain-containing protein [Actinospica acidithermotolerans]MBR7825816.1 beta-lactamase family protein [Actinospica acidithermotolerans]